MQLLESTFDSAILGNRRRVWFQPPPCGQAIQCLCILLDGEYYVERMDVSAVIAELQASPVLPPFAVAYVSHVDAATRWTESFCNPRFADSLADELVPWVNRQLQPTTGQLPTFLGGLSLTGLAAAHAGLWRPDRFSGVLCQSASFWWSDCWLVEACRTRPSSPLRFRISCGSQETTAVVEHGPELIQRTSQLDSNRAMRDALRDRGYSVPYEEFSGGHDLASWKIDLPIALTALMLEPCRIGLQ